MATETDRKAFDRRYDVAAQAGAEIDVGLRSYMLRVYNYMASGLFLSGLVALLIVNTGARDLFFQATTSGRIGYTGLGFLGMLAPIGLILAMSFGAARMKSSTLQMLYWALTATMGISLSVLLIVYTGVSVARVFFITAIAFGGLSLYGYLTKRDLSGVATFFVMGLIGLVIASVVNIFVQSTMLQFMMSIVGVLVFAGLTAANTQQIKGTYFAYGNTAAAESSAIMGAVQLYLDFINLFQFLLMLMGQRRN